MAGGKQWFSFDPTIGAGHLLTALSIIIVGTINYCGVQNDISNLKTENLTRKQEIVDVKAHAEEQEKEMDTKFDNLVKAQHQDMGELRNDMKEWFMNLDQKLDRKADKK